MDEREIDPTPNTDPALSFFDNSPLACVCLDFEGNILAVNSAWLHLLGYERSKVIGFPFLDFVALGYRRQFATGLKLLQSGEAMENRVMGLLHRNGTEITTEADVSSDCAERGSRGTICGIMRDISDQPRDAADRNNLTRRHSLILNAVPGGIVGFDAEGRVTFANPALETIAGWTTHELHGSLIHTILRASNPDGSPRAQHQCDICRAVEQRVNAEGEAWFRKKDGSIFPGFYHTQPYFVDGVYMGGVMTITDITERCETRHKLEQSEAQFRHLFQDAPVALWLEDFSRVYDYIAELKEEGVSDFDHYLRQHPRCLEKMLSLVDIIAVNKATLKLHGAESEQELMGNLAATMTDESIGVFRQEIVALAEDLPGIESMTTLRTLEGNKRPVMVNVFRDNTSSNSPLVYVALTDLSEARNIATINARLVTAIEQSADSIIITEPDGTIVYCNPAFETVTGYSRDEVLGRTPRLLKSGQHDDRFYHDLWRKITAGQVWDGHFVNRTKQGELIEEEGTISPVFDASGKIVNFVAVKRDVTHQLSLEKQLAQSQKMEAVGHLAGGIAHDFNNILHAMLGHLEFARDPDLSVEEIHREMELLQGGAERAADLTRQLLAFSRRQVLDLAYVDPNDVIANLLKMVRRVIGEDIQLEFQPGDIKQQVHVDCGQIEQVLLNLCLNARDAMPAGGRLLIESKLTDVDIDFILAHPWGQVGPHVRIAVRDTGTGIAPDVLPHVFDPFFTTKSTGQGTGLGLATAYGIIKQHGGMILVESTVGHGATFSIYIPVAEGRTDEGVLPEEAATEIPGGTETILIAEDDESVRDVISRILTRAGYKVLETADGQQAIELFNDQPDQIDLALLDMVMPLVGGPEVARHIQQARPAVKILFNTGYSEDAIRGRISPSSQAPLLMKPHNPRDLLITIRELLDDGPRG